MDVVRITFGLRESSFGVCCCIIVLDGMRLRRRLLVVLSLLSSPGTNNGGLIDAGGCLSLLKSADCTLLSPSITVSSADEEIIVMT